MTPNNQDVHVAPEYSRTSTVSPWTFESMRRGRTPWKQTSTPLQRETTQKKQLTRKTSVCKVVNLGTRDPSAEMMQSFTQVLCINGESAAFSHGPDIPAARSKGMLLRLLLLAGRAFDGRVQRLSRAAASKRSEDLRHGEREGGVRSMEAMMGEGIGEMCVAVPSGGTKGKVCLEEERFRRRQVPEWLLMKRMQGAVPRWAEREGERMGIKERVGIEVRSSL